MNSVAVLFIEILAFFIVALLSFSVIRGIEDYLSVRRRLVDRTAQTSSLAPVIRSKEIKNPFLGWVQGATSLRETKEGNALALMLQQAGFEQPQAPVIYVLARFGLAIGLPVLILLMQATSAKPPSGVGMIAPVLLTCGLGLIAPNMIVSRMAENRRSQIEQEFPDTLDLMVVCVEAGLGIDAAFVRVGREVSVSHPHIAVEFERLAHELIAGRGRADALRTMSDRIGVDSVKAFVTLLVQTDSLGVSIGQALRSYAVEMRGHRFLRAEEKAMRIPVLMTVPLVACILPVIITALLLPAVIDVIRTIGPALRGGK